MDCSLAPYLSAVMATVEHLKQLDRQLQAEAAPVAPEVSVHLAEVAAALSELEADRHAVREHLEFQSIENSRLRDRLNNLRERTSREMVADVAAVRESNAEEMQQLSRDLSASRQLRGEAANKLEELYRENKKLHSEIDKVKAEREEIVATLNDQIILKSSLEMQLDQTRALTEELKSSTADAKLEMRTQEESMALERRAFSEQKDIVSREMEQTEEIIKVHMEANRMKQQELDTVKEKKEETFSHLREFKVHIAEWESTVFGLRASRRQCEQQLEEETQKHEELKRQIETLTELHERGEHRSPAVCGLQDQIVAMDGKIEEGCASKLVFQDTLAQMSMRFSRQHNEETELIAEHSRVAEQVKLRLALQKELPLLMEDRMAFMVKQGKEIREMEEKIKELQEEYVIRRRMFKRREEELTRNLFVEKENLGRTEEEAKQVTQLLEDAKKTQDEHEAKMRSDIDSVRTRYKEVLKKQAALQKQLPEYTDIDMLISHMAQTGVAYKQKESILQQKVLDSITETENISKSTKEKQKEVEEKEEMLKEMEDTWIETVSRIETLKKLTSEQREKMTELELSNQAMKGRTHSLLLPKEDMKAELEELRKCYIDLLDKQAPELQAVEVNIYENNVNLEQVGPENSRLHLSIRQMSEDIRTIRQHRDRGEQEIQQLNHKIKVLFESLQEDVRADG